MSYQSSSGFNRSHSQGSSQGNSQGDSQGTTNSASYIPDYEPQLGFLEQFGNLSGRLGQQQYDWAHNEFDNNSRLTDQNINNYLQQHDMASQAAQRDYSNYNDTYNPAISSLGQDWQSYTSPDRVASEMGRAEGDVAQNFEGQRKNIEQNLQSFGVNPSDPRYAGAMAANRTAQGASEAGAGTQARLNTEATGRALRSQALQEAHLLPGQQATEQNVAMQGVTGAQNAGMSNTSLGALTLGTDKDYLNAGISDIKFQPLGNVSASQNTSHNRSQNSSNNTSDSEGMNQSQGAHAPSGGGGGGGSRGGGGDRGGNQGGNQGRNGGNDRNADQNDGRGGDDGSGGRNGDGGGANPAIYNRDPGEEDGGDASGDGGGWNDAAPAGGGDPTAGDPSGWDPGNAGDDPGYGSGWGDYATGIPMDQFDEQFAAGGAIPDGMSPSHGQQTDDVPAQISQTGQRAQLNAGEFVIPKQAVEWYGHKFFQELIAKSIKARQTNAGPAHPTMHGAGGPGVPHAAGGMVVPGTPEWDAAFRANRMGNHARQQNIFHGTHWNPDDPRDQQRAAMSRRGGGGQQRGRQQIGNDTGGSGGQSYGGGQQQSNNPMTSPVQQGIDDGADGGNPMMRMGDPNWQAEQQQRQRSRLPTMNNYQNGTARGQFRPQQNYFQRNPLPQNVSNPGWSDVHAPERSPAPPLPTPTNSQPVNSQPAEAIPTMTLGGGGQQAGVGRGSIGGGGAGVNQMFSTGFLRG